VRSSLFSANIEVDGREYMSLENPRLLRVRLNGELLAREGALVDYQGAIEFSDEGAGWLGKLFKKAATGVPLMRCKGQGDLFLAQNAHDLYLVGLAGGSLTVNGANVLAFDPSLTWDVKRVEGASTFAEGVFTLVFTGTGGIAVSSFRKPIVLDASEVPTFADPASAIAWSSSGCVVV
jgi:uncharacterized protein (AIM24 family)